MISPSACRMGLVTTSRRKIGTALAGPTSLGRRRALLTSNTPSKLSSSSLAGALEKEVWTPLRLRGGSNNRWSSVPHRRWKSSRVAAVYDSETDSDHDGDHDDDLEVRTKGLAAAAQLRATTDKLSHEEAWMINLGRGSDNEWLTGPREEDWFTGVHPRDCPGKLQWLVTAPSER